MSDGSSDNDFGDEEMKSISSSDSDADHPFDLVGHPLHPESKEYAPRQLVVFEAASNDIKHATINYNYEGDEKQRGFCLVKNGRLPVRVVFNNKRANAERFVLILPQQQCAHSLQLLITPDPEQPEVVSSSDDDFRQADMEFNVKTTDLEACSVEIELGGVVLYRAYLGYHDTKEKKNFAIPFRVRRSSNQ